jgi:hypothetical protein
MRIILYVCARAKERREGTGGLYLLGKGDRILVARLYGGGERYRDGESSEIAMVACGGANGSEMRNACPM